LARKEALRRAWATTWFELLAVKPPARLSESLLGAAGIEAVEAGRGSPRWILLAQLQNYIRGSSPTRIEDERPRFNGERR